MSNPSLTPISRQIEALLDSDLRNPLNDFVRRETLRKAEETGVVPSSYDVFAVRRNAQLGDEVFGPMKLHVGNYSEGVLYGIAGSPVMRFRSAIQKLKLRAEKAASVSGSELEYGYEVALVWSEVGQLKDFIGSSPVISEIVAELRTARFQFIGKDSPPKVMEAISSALNLVMQAKRFDSSLVDRFADVLEEGGVDSLAPEALRNRDG